MFRLPKGPTWLRVLLVTLWWPIAAALFVAFFFPWIALWRLGTYRVGRRAW